MHVLSSEPRIVFLTAARGRGPRPMAWQVLFERSFGGNRTDLRYRGTSAANLGKVLSRGFDEEPTLSEDWSYARLDAAMLQGPVIQAFREKQLPDDVESALAGLLVFQEEGLQLDAVKALIGSSKPSSSR